MATSNLNKAELVKITVRGTLDLADFRHNTCRISDGAAAVACTYPDLLKPAVKDALGDMVEAFGEAEATPNNGTHHKVSEVRLQQINVVQRGPASLNQLKPITAQALKDIGFFSLGDDRDDLGDPATLPHTLRESTWGGSE
jgi:hypothetical protein